MAHMPQQAVCTTESSKGSATAALHDPPVQICRLPNTKSKPHIELWVGDGRHIGVGASAVTKVSLWFWVLMVGKL